MSWDIYIQDLPNVLTISDVPADFVPAPIGTQGALIAKLLEVVPFAKRQDHLLIIDRPEVSMEISVLPNEDSDEVRCIALFVRGGSIASECVAAIVHALGRRALDTGTGDFFDPPSPEIGYARWASFRDQALDEGPFPSRT